MRTDKDENRRGGESPAIVKSGGEAEARGFVEAELLEEPVHPTMEMERVQVLDPRHSPTLPRIDLRKLSGPRAPEQRLRVGASPATLERPATKMQPIRIDPEVLMNLSRQAAEKAGRPSTPGAPPLSELGAGERVTLPMEALAPSVRTAAATASEKPASGKLLRALVPLAAVALLVLMALAMLPKGAREEAATSAPVLREAAQGAPAAPTTASGAASSGAVVVATPPVVPPSPVGTVEGDAGASLAPSRSVAIAPNRPKARNDDLHGAAVPRPVQTVEAAVPPPLVTAAPSAPVAPPPVPPVKPIPAPSPVPASSSPQRMFGTEP